MLTQNWVAPWIKVTPPIEESKPEPAMTEAGEQKAEADAIETAIRKYLALLKILVRYNNLCMADRGPKISILVFW